MFCKICKNLLLKTIVGDAMKLICMSCNESYAASVEDSLIYEDHKDEIPVASDLKAGDLIYHYPTSQKILTKDIKMAEFKNGCPKCHSDIIGWDKTPDGQKIYGCRCGMSWLMQSS